MAVFMSPQTALQGRMIDAIYESPQELSLQIMQFAKSYAHCGKFREAFVKNKVYQYGPYLDILKTDPTDFKNVDLKVLKKNLGVYFKQLEAQAKAKALKKQMRARPKL